MGQRARGGGANLGGGRRDAGPRAAHRGGRRAPPRAPPRPAGRAGGRAGASGRGGGARRSATSAGSRPTKSASAMHTPVPIMAAKNVSLIAWVTTDPQNGTSDGNLATASGERQIALL